MKIIYRLMEITLPKVIHPLMIIIHPLMKIIHPLMKSYFQILIYFNYTNLIKGSKSISHGQVSLNIASYVDLQVGNKTEKAELMFHPHNKKSPKLFVCHIHLLY
jgi:hypothetical protein